MTIKDLINKLNKLDKDKEIIFSSDEEGNNFYIDADITLTQGIYEEKKHKLVYVIYPFNNLDI